MAVEVAEDTVAVEVEQIYMEVEEEALILIKGCYWPTPNSYPERIQVMDGLK
jgi:hypothetical protein